MEMQYIMNLPIMKMLDSLERNLLLWYCEPSLREKHVFKNLYDEKNKRWINEIWDGLKQIDYNTNSFYKLSQVIDIKTLKNFLNLTELYEQEKFHQDMKTDAIQRHTNELKKFISLLNKIENSLEE